jgi:tetratricopeptide (TPR) repeat protein
LSAVTDGCLEETTVLAFLGGTLRPRERSTIEGHIAACSACADLVTWVAADQANNTVRMPGREGRPFVGQLHPGARVGRYQILGAVGRGGMGEVYAAYHPDLDRRIALKVVQSADGGGSEGRGRLLREARAIARLSHPNVVTVHDAGTFGDRVFIAMELINGATIDDWLRAEPRSWREILDVFIAAGRGLAAAHAAGIVHRDFKPQNVMIAKDGGVRVMDFGLARLAADDAGDRRTDEEATQPITIGALTKTGAVVGTPAYMAPEQFRREGVDARSDQFSFCVALHEALFGKRPAVALLGGGEQAGEVPLPSRPDGVPGWLRSIVLRGASAEREQRYRSMDELVAALERGRMRVRRRVSLAAISVAAIVVTAGAWRVAHGSRFVCALPQDRIAAVWAADANDSRRQSIHRAFAATGRPTAETSWERVSKVLDDYMTAWSAMYLQTCEATHVRGEQSAEVLDLRMSCLSDNLDQVRALTDALMTADGTAVSRAVAAAQDLASVSRCADIALLRSAVPLPRDDKTLGEVQRLRRVLAEIQTRQDLADFATVLKRSRAVTAEVEATGYKPLLGELMFHIGIAEAERGDDPLNAEATLRKALLIAEAAKDDLTAAKAVANLVFVVGYCLGRTDEAEHWAALGNAILDRIGGDHARLRAWIANNLSAGLVRSGDFERARTLAEESLSLKERSLGKDHPDVAISLGALGYALVRGGHPEEALVPTIRAIEIFRRNDPDTFFLAATYSNQGEALNAMGQHKEAEIAFNQALRILSRNGAHANPEVAFARNGLGECKLAQGAPVDAIVFFADALRIREAPYTDPALLAESQFGLARALWDAGGDRRRARQLAQSARDAYAKVEQSAPVERVANWLTSHQLGHLP